LVQGDSELATNSDCDAALWVRRAVEKLDASEREILMLREYEQLSYSEIAQLLRIPVNTVRSRLFRARLALKIWLEPEKRAHRSETPINAPARPTEGEV
jgi:RNA polymerase sigma-70 factor (ECF subfamily)